MALKSVARILTEEFGDEWREIAPGVYLAPPGTPGPPPQRTETNDIKKALEELL